MNAGVHELYLIETDDGGRPPIVYVEMRCRCQDSLSDFDQSKLRLRIRDEVPLAFLLLSVTEHAKDFVWPLL